MRTRFSCPSRQLLLIVVLVTTTPAAAHSDDAWAYNGVGVCASPGDHVRMATVSDGLGGAFVVWADSRTGSQDLYALRIDDSGQPALDWPPCGVRVCAAAGNQQFGTAVSDRHGGVIVLWDDDRETPKKIFAQRLDANGNLQWNVDGVRACDADSEQLLATAIPDERGGAIALWWDKRRAPPPFFPRYHPRFDLFTQRIDASGTRDWDPGGVPVCADSGDRKTPGPNCMDSDGAGGAVLLFVDDIRGGYWAQRIDVAGSRRWGEDGSSITTIGGKGDAVADSAGGMWVVTSDGRDGLYHVWAEHLDSSGAIVSTPGGILVNGTGPDEAIDDQFRSSVPDGAGGIITTWCDTRSHKDRDIFAQHVLAAGNVDPSWPVNGVSVCTAPGVQINPSIVGDDSSGAIIAWYDVRDTSTGYDIYAQRVTGTGKISSGWPVNGRRLCGAANNQVYPDLVTNGLGGAIVSWDDYRDVYQNAYVQRVRSNGAVGTEVTGVDAPHSAFALDAPRPNPATRDLLISFSLDRAGPARLDVFDVRGRRIQSRDLESLGAGRHLIRLSSLGSLSPGVYLLRLTEGSDSISRRVAVVR